MMLTYFSTLKKESRYIVGMELFPEIVMLGFVWSCAPTFPNCPHPHPHTHTHY